MPVFEKIVIVGDDQGSAFILTDTHLTVKRKQEKKWDWLQYDVPLRHVVWSELIDDVFEVSFLARKRNKAKGPLHLEQCTGKVDAVSQGLVRRFTEHLQNAAYVGVKPGRRLKVIVNPKAGPGKSEYLYKKHVVPLLRASKCSVDVVVTTHFQHAIEISRVLPLDKFDAVITVGGDGMIYEVLNGFAEHQDPMQALKIPIAPVPTGSGNGLSINILGLNEGLDILAATLNGVKGRPMPVDVVSVAQGSKRALSFMMQSTGLMAEADLGSEHLRAIGSSRFIVYFLLGVAKHRHAPVKIQIKVAGADKQKMVEDLHASQAQAKLDLEQMISKSRSAPQPYADPNEPPVTTSGPFITTSGIPTDECGAASSHAQDAPAIDTSDPASSEAQKSSNRDSGSSPSTANTTPPPTPPSSSSSLPPLKYASLKDDELREEDGWMTITDPILWYMAGKGPYVGDTFMAFPVSVPNEGVIDVTLHKPTSRAGLIKAIDGAEKGKLYWTNDELYYKATAYRVTPLPSRKYSSLVSIDGEAFKFEPYHVEVHAGLANLLSPYGYYCADFDIPPPKPKHK